MPHEERQIILPKFLLANDPSAEAAEAQYVVHNAEPRYVARVRFSTETSAHVFEPLFLDDPSSYAPEIVEQSVTEGRRFYEELIQKIAKEAAGD